MSAPLSVLIIGCGNIAGGFDAERPADAWPLTHAGAYLRHGSFRLDACVEPDAERRQAFMSRWSVREGHESIQSLAHAARRFDVISICSSTRAHCEHLAAAIELRPRAIFCEKPVSLALGETETSVRHCEAAGILLAVNYTRRWAPDLVRLRDELRARQWGTVRSVVGHYNKGVLNNGGHMLDLLHFLIGPVRLAFAGRPIWDFWDDDPSIPAQLESDSGVPVYLNATHAGDFAYFELQICTSSAVLVMEDGGLGWRVRRVGESAHFRGYKALASAEQRAGEYAQAMLRAITNIHDAIFAGVPLASTGHSALEAQRLCERIKADSFARHGESHYEHDTRAIT